MKKLISGFFTGILSLSLLVACQNQRTMIKRMEQASCKMTCQKRFKICQQACHDNCQTCAMEVQKTVNRSYAQYRHEAYIQGGIDSRELNSFKDPLQCRKTSCDCRADNEVCVQSCTGIIHKNMRVPSACC